MGEKFKGLVEIQNAANALTIGLDGDHADIAAGGNGQDGNVILKDSKGNERICMDGQTGDVIIKNADGDEILRVNGNEGDIIVKRKIDGVPREVMKFDASRAALYIGSEDNEGDIFIRNNAGDDTFIVNGNEGDIIVKRKIDGVQREVMKFDASNAFLSIGCEGNEGDILVRDGAGRDVFHFNSNNAALYLGAAGNEGDIIIRNNDGDDTFQVDGNEGDIFVWRKIGGVKREVMKFDASNAFLSIGCEGNEGDILVRDGAGRDVFHFDSNSAALYLGAAGNEGDIIIRNNDGDDTFKVDGNEGDIFVWRKIGGVKREVMKFDASNAFLSIGCEGNEGDILVRDGAGRDVFHFDSNYAALYIGAAGNEGDVIVRDGAGNERIRLDGHTGDIKLQGADCAEEFDVTEIEKIGSGTVLVIDDESKLQPCKEPYDKKVAGVVSGGNGSNPGIILDKNPTQTKRLPIALNGKVYCKADAQYSPIEVGDLLTTSPTDGHAMKAEEPLNAFGAVIGKALRSLREGKGMIPILVALQ